MDPILIFVVLPLATIIFSIALQRIFKCPILVSAIIFAIFLILTYTVFGTDFIIFAILFAVLAFITAFLSNIFCKLIRRLQSLEERNSERDCEDNEECSCGGSRSGRNSNDQNSRNSRNNNGRCNSNNYDNENLLTISSRCGNGDSAELLTISTGGTCVNNNNNDTNNCNCGCNNERIVLNAEVVPTNNGRSGAFRGCFRRRWN